MDSPASYILLYHNSWQEANSIAKLSLKGNHLSKEFRDKVSDIQARSEKEPSASFHIVLGEIPVRSSPMVDLLGIAKNAESICNLYCNKVLLIFFLCVLWEFARTLPKSTWARQINLSVVLCSVCSWFSVEVSSWMLFWVILIGVILLLSLARVL